MSETRRPHLDLTGCHQQAPETVPYGPGPTKTYGFKLDGALLF